MVRTMLPIPPSGSPVDPRSTWRLGSWAASMLEETSDIGRIISQNADPGDKGPSQLDITPSIASIAFRCSDSRYSSSRSATVPKKTLAKASSSSEVARRAVSAARVGGASKSDTPRRSAKRLKKSKSAA